MATTTSANTSFDNKQNKAKRKSSDRITIQLSLPHQEDQSKQTNRQNLNHNSPYKGHATTGPTLAERLERKKNSTFFEERFRKLLEAGNSNAIEVKTQQR